MGRLDNYVWYCCQDPIPFFRLRILKILSIILGIGLFIVILPVIGLLNIFIPCAQENFMTNRMCYDGGLMTFIIAFVVACVLIFMWILVSPYITSQIQENNIKDHCFRQCGCMPCCGVYVSVIFGIGIFGIGVPYGITLAIWGTISFKLFFITMMIELTGIVALLPIYVLFCQRLKSLTECDSEIEESRKLSLDHKSNIQYDSVEICPEDTSDQTSADCDSSNHVQEIF